MAKPLTHAALIVKKSSIHGLGVFADTPIPAGSIIEECHTIILNQRVMGLHNYHFYGGPHKYILALGYGSIYNHSNDENATFNHRTRDDLLVFTAKKNIAKGEEIFINYGEEWFRDRKINVRQIESMKSRNIKMAFRFLLLFAVVYFLFMSK